MNRLGSWLTIAMLLGSLGCKPDAALKKSEIIGRGSAPIHQPNAVPDSVVISQPATAEPDPSTFGSISGSIRLDGKAPKPVRIDMSQDPACSLSHVPNYSEQYVVYDGNLANVFLYIKSGPPAAMSAPAAGAPVILDQKGCRYIPHVIAIPLGGWVEFHNSDPTMHNVHTMPIVAGNRAADISQSPMGTPQKMQFNQPEQMIPVRCNNHPWMNAFLNVAATPYAISGANGHFTIKNLPPGTYTLAAVHERLGEQTVTITVAPKTDTTADIVYTIK